MAAKPQVAGSVGMHRSEAEETRERSDAPEGAARRCAGFPSPAEQYLEPPLDLNELLVKRPAATFFVRVEGDSMINAGIHDKDLLVVDRSLTPANGDIIIAAVDGEFTVKTLRVLGNREWGTGNRGERGNRELGIGKWCALSYSPFPIPHSPSKLYQTIDALNAKLGKGKVFSAAEGVGTPTWRMKRSKLSKRATTNWDELLTVR